ncbi:MAG: hypothetical protein ACK5G0_05540 [Bacteroidota bacterium]
MLRRIMLLLVMGSSMSLFAQPEDVVMNVHEVSSNATLQKRVFKAAQPTEDKVELIDVVGLGQTTYTASNVMDGSVKSFEHSMRILVALNMGGNKPGACQLVFYSAAEKIQQAASAENGTVSIYYPISVYESLRSRLEQALIARKKVQVKVTLKTTGFREGVLIF